MNVQFESKSHEYVIIISLLFVTINNFLFIPRSTFAARAEQAKQDIPDIIRTLMHQIFRVVIVLLGYKAVALALGNLASLILITPFILFLFKDYPKDFFDKKLASKYVKLSLPILIMGMATTVVANLDRVILQYITNSEQVGYYTVSFRIGGLVRLIANSIGMLFFPLFSMASSKGDFFYIKDKIEKIERFSYVFIMPLVLFLAIYSDTIVHFLLGREYIPGIPALSILTVAMFVQILNMPYGNVVTGLGYFKLAAAVNLVNLFFFIISLVIFIHPKIFGLNATGAAISVLSSQIFLGILGRFYAKKKVDILDITKYMKFVYFGVINFILLFLFYTSFKDFWGMKSRLIFPVFYFLLTYLSLVVIKWIDKNDWQMLLSIVNIKAMKKYIDKEILRK